MHDQPPDAERLSESPSEPALDSAGRVLDTSRVPAESGPPAPPVADGAVPGETLRAALDAARQPAAATAADFGLLDVVEAFTAMRHDWKTQARESRGLAETVLQAVERLEQLARTRPEPPPAAAPADGASEARSLAESLAELDYTVERAVTAAARTAREQSVSPAETLRRAADELQSRFASAGWFRRWRSSVWQRAVAEWLRAEAARLQPESSAADPLLEGLLMMRERVRRLLADRGIERQEVTGQMFDAERMHAVDAVDAPGTPAGHVVEQLRPAYFWKGKRIRDAEVRVAR